MDIKQPNKRLTLYEINKGMTFMEFCSREIFEHRRDCKNHCQACPHRVKIEEAMKYRYEQLDNEQLARCHEDEARIAEKNANDIINKIQG